MADGGGTRSLFQSSLDVIASEFGEGLFVADLFAGGGGASHALREALGREPDLCANHDEISVALHAANHPISRHFCEDIWRPDPRLEVGSRAFGWLHASPDCRDHSQARGNRPRDRAIRALSWVVMKWAGTMAKVGNAPLVITLENVTQILRWGNLIAKRCPKTGRVVRLDGTVAAKGERVPVAQQHLVPDPKRLGSTWRRFVASLEGLGYVVEFRTLNASDFGAGTNRVRLFMIARRDGRPIRWPAPSHGEAPGLTPRVCAADGIDWSIPCPSIFGRRKPLVDATLRRVAKGLVRFVLDAKDPFLVPTSPRDATGAPSQAVAGMTAHVAKFRGASAGSAIDAPLPTITSGAGSKRPAGAPHALGVVTAYLEQANTGMVGHDVRKPLSTIVGRASTQRLVTAHLATLRRHSVGIDARSPLPTIAAGGEHHAVVQVTLSRSQERAALRVADLLIRHADAKKPLTARTTRERLALVTVMVEGVAYVIVDIGLRMLRARELFTLQGFPPSYVIDRTADGRDVKAYRAVRMVGNSVSPPPMVALVRANRDALPRVARPAPLPLAA